MARKQKPLKHWISPVYFLGTLIPKFY